MSFGLVTGQGLRAPSIGLAVGTPSGRGPANQNRGQRQRELRCRYGSDWTALSTAC